LEQEAGRNVELLWLLNKLRPDFKTIADFRKDNAKAILQACRSFTVFCRSQCLFGAELVAVDGSKFRAASSKKAVWTSTRVESTKASIDRRIKEYLEGLDRADRQEPKDDPEAVQSALKALRERREALSEIEGKLKSQSQLVATEPDAKLMRTAQDGMQVAYNVQTAVDAKHALIAEFAVTNDGNDHQQLAPMAAAAKGALEVPSLTVIADTGYQNGEQAGQCEQNGITAIVPAPLVPNTKGKAFTQEQFAYYPEQDAYQCPAGAVLRKYKSDKLKQIHQYKTNACPDCPLKAQCTDAKFRSITRSFHAAAAERMNARAKQQPELFKRRKMLAEHPFAGLKYLLGNSKLLVRGIERASAEIALAVLAYNMKRSINILTGNQLIAALRAT
jgi:transposase